MAVKTNAFGVSRALSFFNITEVYFGLGKSTEWTAEDYSEGENIPADPENRPPATKGDTNFLEPIGYRKVDQMYLVVPHDGSTTEDLVIDFVGGTQWRTISVENAQEEDARYVFLRTTIQAGDFAEGTYRQVGVFSNLTKAEGVPIGQNVLSPSEVSDVGIMEIIDNRKLAPLNDYSKETLEFIIKF